MVSLENEAYLDDLTRIRPYLEALTGKSDKSVLITGATGLIGSFLVDAIVVHNRTVESGKIILSIITRNRNGAIHRFPYVSPDEIKIIEQGIREGFPDDKDYDYIIHLASNADPASYRNEPFETIEANVTGAIHLSRYLRNHLSARAVVASSMEVYGESDRERLGEEDFGTLNFNIQRAGYPESKRVAELLLKGAVDEYGTQCVIARLGYIYGPTMRDADNKIVSELIRKAHRGESVELQTPGIQRRSYCYVGDAVSALLLLLEKGGNGETYNVADRHSVTTIRELADLICDMYQLSLTVRDGVVPRTNTNVVLDATKLECLGWKAEVPLEEGIRRSVSAWKD